MIGSAAALPRRQRGSAAGPVVNSTTRRRGRLFAGDRGAARIDYRDARVISARAADKQRQRELTATGPWVIGRWIVRGGVVHLEAVRVEPGWWVDDAAPLTTDLASFARWCTRQGAGQWLQRHARPGCHLVNLEQLLAGRRRQPLRRRVVKTTTRQVAS